MNLSSIIYYTDPETGECLEYETLSGDQNRIWVEYEELPKDLINAAVAIEDRRYYEHNGVDWLSTAKGVFNFFTGGRIRGGSTITQQMIKNFTQRDEVTVKRKIIEIFTALDVDKKYSKEQILELYLNKIYFGRKCYGVYTAAYMYFGKNVSELSLAECASLISITNNPSLYDPYTHPENNAERRGYVLDGMVRDGKISQEECDAAKAEEIDFHSGSSSNQSNTLYTWYTEQVITDVIRGLMDEYGYDEDFATQIVYSGGLKIYACVDVNVQAVVNEVYSNVENLPYTSRSGQQLQSAITVIDEKGNVVALAGKLGEKT
ncbi:MAG: transglycosylase domain-containing protein, partial [Oscillospiraceae bacterium]|nr:transglycosylase domain-containing protein [Oscillospiraceae bacterium]